MNPYSFVDAVIDPRMFYGYRQGLDDYRSGLDDIVRDVTALQIARQSFLVIGGRMIGKTSFLRQIERRVYELNTNSSNSVSLQRFIPLYIDMSHLCEGKFATEVFFDKIAHMLNSYFHKNRLDHRNQSPARFTIDATKPLESFMDALHDWVTAAQGAKPPVLLRLVFLIDDLWRAQHREDDVQRRDQLQDAIGALCSNLHTLYRDPLLAQRVAYVISATYHESEEIGNRDPIMRILNYHFLQAFGDGQSRALINEPTEGKIPSKIAHQVLVATGGHPYLLQYLMSKLCNRPDWTQLTDDDISRAIKDFGRERRDLRRWWSKLSKVDRKVYETFCQEGGPLSLQELTRRKLSIKGSKGTDLVLDGEMIERALLALSTTGLIREYPDDSSYEPVYKLAGEWPKRWFLSNFSEAL